MPSTATFPSTSFIRHSNTAIGLCTTKPTYKDKLSASAMQHSEIQPASYLLRIHFMGAKTVTSISTNQLS